jgi:hypothetical protein
MVVGSALEESNKAVVQSTAVQRRDKPTYRRILLSIESARLKAEFIPLGVWGKMQNGEGTRAVKYL